MINFPATTFPADEQFTAEFFATRDVQLSVELAERCDQTVMDTRSDLPSFFCWKEGGSLYLVDFLDGFSVPLTSALGVALSLVAAAGIKLTGLLVHWRDETKTWHTLTPDQILESRVEPLAVPVAA